MMFPEDPLEGLSQLTERQREVLQLVCDGLSYKDIAVILVVAEATVKAHMGNIYQKLGLDLLPPAQRRKLIYEVCCPGLGDAPPPVPEESVVEPEAVPDKVARMVEEDERAIVPWQPAPLVAPEEIIEVRPRPVRAIRLRWLVFGMILGVILASGFFYAFGDQIFGEISTSEQEVVGMETVVEKLVEVTVEVEKTVVVTAEPGPEQPTSPPQIVEVIVSATPLPTPVPSPIPTEPVNTPPDTILEVGEWWKHEGVWTKVSEVEFGSSSTVEIRIEFWNKTGNDLIFEWSPTGNFSMIDNTNHRYEYEWYSQSGVNSEVIPTGELVQLHHTFYGDPAVTFDDSHYFDANVTDLYFTIADISRLPFAQWHISVPK
jgi:DNA-binding CsgD family transcriptional regulator